jgi:spore coat polysaccharide biosynthesis predicted glycosyltransferase SpsG
MIVFRADLSPQSGLFRLRRCAWLAALLKKRVPVRIRCREDKKAAKFLAARGIPAEVAKEPGAMDLAGITALVFDLAEFSAADVRLLENAKKAGVKTLQIVDPGGAGQPADLLLQPFTEAESQDGGGRDVLQGPAYALLHHKFRHFHQARRKYRGKIRNLFINLGDLLPYRDLRLVIDTLHRLRLQMKIAPGLSLKKADRRNLMKIYPGIHFCGRSESPARAYFEADLALISPGDEALEAAAVGTPALYMPMAKGQESLADAWTAKEFGVKIPSLADFSVSALRDAMVPLTLERRERMGAAGRALVDGLGVQRLFIILEENGIIS